jgi:cyclopropane-fatty-acyl-phospholipid synthase
MTVATIVEPLVRATLGDRIPIGIRCWDGSRIGPSGAAVNLFIAHRRALRRLLWAPNELGFARAYVSGDVEVEGDLLAGLDALERIAPAGDGPGVVVDRATVPAAARMACREFAATETSDPPASSAHG